MPAPVLHLGANVRCSHNGVATPVVSTAYVITGCTLVGTPSPPCWTGRWLTGATRVIAGGVPVVTLAGTSVSEPAGTPMLPVTAQTRVLAS